MKNDPNFNNYKYKNGKLTFVSEMTWNMMDAKEKQKYTDKAEDVIVADAELRRQPIRIPIDFDAPSWNAEEKPKDYKFYKDFYDKWHETIEGIEKNNTSDNKETEPEKAEVQTDVKVVSKLKKTKTIKEKSDGDKEQKNR